MYREKQQKLSGYCASRGRIKVCDFSLPDYNRPLLLMRLCCWEKKKNKKKNPSFFDCVSHSSFSLVKQEVFWILVLICYSCLYGCGCFQDIPGQLLNH